MSLTSRDRFVRLMRGEPVDRAPFFPVFRPWPQTIERWRQEGLPEEYDYRALGFDGDLRHKLPVNAFWCPSYERQLLDDEGDAQVVIDERGVKRRERDGGWSIEFLAHPVHDRCDWDRLKDRLDPACAARFPDAWAAFCTQHAQRTEPAYAGDLPCGFFGGPREILGFERLLYLFYDDPGLAHEMLDFLTEYFLTVIRRALKETDADWFHYFEDYAYKVGPMFGPNIFRQFLLPRYRRITDFLHIHGVQHVWLDSDGDSQLLIPLMIEAGISGHCPLERAAGMDPLKLRAEYGHDLTLMGGIDKRALAKGREAIEQELYHHVPQLLEEGGYIPTVDHTVPPDVSYGNFCYYVELKRKLLGY